VIVASLLVYAIIRFRRKPGDDLTEPPQVYGSNQIEIAWTVIPILIVFVLFMVTARVVSGIQDAKAPRNALHATIIGHQWWWEIYYPDLGITTANELNVPESGADHQPTYLKLQSVDVIHSFWVPQLAPKMDVIPNRNNQMWLDPKESGTFLGGTSAEGKFGPDLTHLMSRQTLGSGMIPNNRENLRAWIKDPQEIKPGCLMPSMQLGDSQLDAVVSYLFTLK
jgi:cytochrome c oxidase subunit 2